MKQHEAGAAAVKEKEAYYGLYKGVRNAAWLLLLRANIGELPVRCGEVAARMAIPVLDYIGAKPLLHALGLELHCEDNDGFAVHINGRWCVFLNSAASEASRNYTLAHELGHVFLGHVMEEKQVSDGVRVRYTRVNRREWELGLDRSAAMERDANMFAMRLLSPACALWGLGLHTPGEIARVCGLPPHMARKRADRMRVLYERNLFLKSGVEAVLFERFMPYLRAQREDGQLPEHCLRKLREIEQRKKNSKKSPE